MGWVLPLLNFIFSEKLSAIYLIVLFQKFKKTQNRLYLCNRWSYEFLKPLFDPKGSKMRFYIYMGHTIWNLAFWFEQCRELSNVENWKIPSFPCRVFYYWKSILEEIKFSNAKWNISKINPQQTWMKMTFSFFNYNLASSFHDFVDTFMDTMFTNIGNNSILKV